MLYPQSIEQCSLTLGDAMNQSNTLNNILAIACLVANIAALLLAVIISLGIVLGLA